MPFTPSFRGGRGGGRGGGVEWAGGGGGAGRWRWGGDGGRGRPGCGAGGGGVEAGGPHLLASPSPLKGVPFGGVPGPRLLARMAGPAIRNCLWMLFVQFSIAQLQRRQLLRYRQSLAGEAADVPDLPGRPGRCLRVRPSAVHVRRGDERSRGLRFSQGVPVPASYSLPRARRLLRPMPPNPRAAVHPASHLRPAAKQFRGVRIFDIRDIGPPRRQIAAVPTCTGSHTTPW
jgi:hypothetical protein